MKDSAYKFFEFQMKPLLTTKVSQHCPSGLKSNDFRADKEGRPRGAGRSGMRWKCRCCAPHPSTHCTGRGGCSPCGNSGEFPEQTLSAAQKGPKKRSHKCRYSQVCSVTEHSSHHVTTLCHQYLTCTCRTAFTCTCSSEMSLNPRNFCRNYP